MSAHMSRAALGHGWSRRKRRALSTEPPSDAEIISEQQAELEELRGRFSTLMSPLDIKCEGIYDMDKESDSMQLADALWRGNIENSMNGLRSANAPLVSVLEAQLKNNYHPPPHLRAQAEATKALQLDGTLAHLLRTRSQKCVTLLSAALSVLADASGISEEFWNFTSSFFKGALLSARWTKAFMPLAASRRPPPVAGALEGVVIAVFDNLTMQCDYGGYFKGGKTGTKLDMTNWLWTTIPPHLSTRASFYNIGTCA